MLDVAIRGAMVVDGTGRPARRADIGVRDGRIVAIGTVDEDADRTIDADGHVACPGFVDVHTHYDAQLFWDPTFSPSPLHGVTTVIAGNCGISLAPVAPDDEDFLVRLLSRVEAIPLESLSLGVKFEWGSFPEFLDAVDHQDLAINVGFMVGHSALRRFAMGAAASSDPASAEQLRTMREALSEALAAGGFGFSSSTARTQLDGDGRPTPPTYATDAEMIAMARECGRHPGTSLEFIPESAAYGFDAEGRDLALMSAMSRAARRHVNWNTVLLRYPGKPDIQDLQLGSAEVGRSEGAAIVPMMVPHNFRVRTDFLDSDTGFRSQPGFARLFELDPGSRHAALQEPRMRAELLANFEAATDWPTTVFRDALGELLVSDATAPEMQRFVGRSVADIAGERRAGRLETVFDLAVESQLEIGFTRYLVPVATGEQRALRRRVLRDPRLVLGASDGGAHVRGVVNVEYSTASFAELVRDDDVFTLEELVQELTDVPARLYGLTDRGRIELGTWADIVIFDPETIAPSAVSMKRDLPGGSARLFTSGRGIDAVLVAGQEVVRDGAVTDRRPGRLLRSGRDSATTPRNRLLSRRRRDEQAVL
ncbi:MAG: aminoacylase [Actinomycetia bacterium]|nr:aminoacylase [Actinomycetes bacterium]